MIVDKLMNANRYAGTHPGLAAAFAVLRREDLAELPPGPAEIDGERLTINVLKAPARPRDEVKMECHRKYIDVQYVISGAEEFSWRPISECVQPESDFDIEADFGLFADEPEGWFPLNPGMFVVFFPEDAHGPMAGNDDMHKVVVKVAVEWE
jgi:biofilm protein TabA